MADECVNMLNLYTEDEKVFALLGEIFGEDNPAYRLSQETGQYSGSKWIEIQEALPGKEGDTFELCLYFLSAWAPPLEGVAALWSKLNGAFDFLYTYRVISFDTFAGACQVVNGEVRYHQIPIDPDDHDSQDDLDDALDFAKDAAEDLLDKGGGEAVL